MKATRMLSGLSPAVAETQRYTTLRVGLRAKLCCRAKALRNALLWTKSATLEGGNVVKDPFRDISAHVSMGTGAWQNAEYPRVSLVYQRYAPVTLADRTISVLSYSGYSVSAHPRQAFLLSPTLLQALSPSRDMWE